MPNSILRTSLQFWLQRCVHKGGWQTPSTVRQRFLRRQLRSQQHSRSERHNHRLRASPTANSRVTAMVAEDGASPPHAGTNFVTTQEHTTVTIAEKTPPPTSTHMVAHTTETAQHESETPAPYTLCAHPPARPRSTCSSSSYFYRPAPSLRLLNKQKVAAIVIQRAWRRFLQDMEEESFQHFQDVGRHTYARILQRAVRRYLQPKRRLRHVMNPLHSSQDCSQHISASDLLTPSPECGNEDGVSLQVQDAIHS